MQLRRACHRFAMTTLGVLVSVTCCWSANDRSLNEVESIRRPIALVRRGTDLFVANRETGSVSQIDLKSLQVEGERKISKQLTDLVAVPGSGSFVAVDSSTHELIRFDVEEHRDPVRIRVAAYPSSVAVFSNGKMATVASRWSRQVTFVGLSEPQIPSVLMKIDLPFAADRQLVLDERHVLVADAFGGHLAVIDVSERCIEAHREINGHNIRGLALSADRKEVLITHQIMLSITATTKSRIGWGGVVSNSLQRISVAELLKPYESDHVETRSVYGRLYPLGEERNAAGDPAGVTTCLDGREFVALAGVHQIGMKRRNDLTLERGETGRRPTALYFDELNDRLFVANTFDDSVSVLDGQTLEAQTRIQLGPIADQTSEQIGEELFYDARLSLDGWFSCHSCHSDGHTTGRLNDNFSDGSFGTPKRILSLLGAGETRPWGWNGTQQSLHRQAISSIENTMAGPGKTSPTLSDSNVAALASFVASLEPAPSVAQARGQIDQETVQRGRNVFRKQGCAECHHSGTFTSPVVADVGLRDEAGLKKFNPPSLRGVSQRGPFLHDNRAATLRELLTTHDHGGSSGLAESRLRDLITFLNSI